jgi:D-threo-aldose 1-dehydrogenase
MHNTKLKLGRTNIEVTEMSFGAAPIGNIFRTISEEDSRAMVDLAWDSGIRCYDTAPMYGHGLSEARIGESLRWKNRDEYTLVSKVGRVLRPAKRSEIDFTPWVDGLPFKMEFDYSYDGVMRAFEDSNQRLGLEHIDVAFIHDIDVFTHGEDQQKIHFKNAMDGAYKALENLRSNGHVSAIGVGVNEAEVCFDALKHGDFDGFLLAGRYTLLEQDALDDFLPLCEQRNAFVLVGGGFNSGILATGAVEGAKYNYAPAPDDIMKRVAGIEQVCKEFNVPLPAAALQFVVAHPAVPSFIAGVRNTEQLQGNIDCMNIDIPSQLWQTLKDKGLLRKDAPTPA